MRNQNKTRVAFVLAAAVILAGFFTFSKDARSADCSLSFTGPHGNQIYVGDTVAWKLESGFYGGYSYWYGTKNGEVDVNGSDTSLPAFFTQNFGPYQPESVGHYERFIVVKDLLYQYLCQTQTVTFDVIQPPASTPESLPSVSPTPSPSTGLTSSPQASPEPTATPAPAAVDLSELAKIKNGDLIKTADIPSVWRVKIAGGKRYKQWLFGPQAMKANGYSFKKIKIVRKDILDQFEISYLVSQARGDGKVYFIDSIVSGSSAVKHWIPTYETFQKYGYSFGAVFYAPKTEMDLYASGNDIAMPNQSQSGIGANNFTANISDILLRFFGRVR